jgi:hypothetical protein
MKDFDFSRFVALLVRALEIGIIAALALRWIDALVGLAYMLLRVGSRIVLPSAVVDAALNFSLLAILLLLLATLWYLFTSRSRAMGLAIRTGIYIVVFCVSPTRLGSSGPKSAQRPNQSMERTSTRRAFTFRVAWTPSLRPTLALGGRRSSCSR